MSDNVHSPSHYQMDGLDIEVIDVIRSVLGSEKFEGYCRGNVIKYITRADKKNEIEDLKKAMVYLKWEIESKEKEKNFREAEERVKITQEEIEKWKDYHLPTTITTKDYTVTPHKTTLTM